MITLTNSLRKTIVGLDKAKMRRETGLFMAEGDKCVLDTIDHFPLSLLISTSQWLDTHPTVAKLFKEKLCTVSPKELERLSHFSTPPHVIAIYEIPSQEETHAVKPGLALALDTIQDPGNLGTILRTCDWYGVDTVYCSRETADVYSPKVVQASMGAISRVRTVYLDLDRLLADYPYPVYGTLLDGKNIYESELSSDGLLVMGNEGKGISLSLRPLLTHKLCIPSYPPERETSESLNVAIATAVSLAEFRRRSMA